MAYQTGFIEKVIQELDIDTIDPKFILEAIIVDARGNQSTLVGEQLRELLYGPDIRKLRSAKVKLDTRGLKMAMYLGILDLETALEAREAADTKIE
jgi:hypothetical protein